ncbi:MAG TPA: D-alanyl-D-alanine carboxypeptidase family protein [Thermoleophilaceae bacterium]|nr:D-alanyl-D-alanine carboxypeptidase family protein [Thermoleophilaceae bacterium]
MIPAAASSPRRVRTQVVALAVALAAAVLGATASPSAGRVPRPDPEARAAIVIDARSGEPLFERRADRPRPIASATKLMTALLLLERTRPSDVLTAARYDAAPIESQIGLRAGERMRVRDLLSALLLESANDAAVTVARNLSGSRAAFVRDMNRRARELGLRSTSYTNPIGLDSPRNRSSARDLAKLATRLLRVPVFARTVAWPRARLRSGARSRTVRNRNTLVGAYRFVTGVKTGHTLGAGYVLVGSGRAHGADVVSVVLGSPTEAARNADSLAILRWGLDRFKRRRVVRAGAEVASRPISGRGGARVALGAPSGLVATVREGRPPALVVRAPRAIEGPLPAGRRVGAVELRDGAHVLASAPLVTAAAVPGPKPLSWLTRPAVLGAGLTALVLLAMVSTVVLLRRRRRGRRTTTNAP